MSRRRMATLGAVGALAIGLMARGWTSFAQGPTLSPAVGSDPAASGRFEFLVVESFDALYEGDTPGHIGRGGLGRAAPRVALDDPVYRGNEKVGRVTRLIWSEAKESLEVEFDPEDGVRVQIGDPIWLRLGPPSSPPARAR